MTEHPSGQSAFPCISPTELKSAATDMDSVFDAVINPAQCHHCNGGVPTNLRHRYVEQGFMHCGEPGKLVCLFCNAAHACSFCCDYASKGNVHLCRFSNICGMYLSAKSALQLHEEQIHSSVAYCLLCKFAVSNHHCEKLQSEVDPSSIEDAGMASALVIPAGMKLQCPFCEVKFEDEHDVRIHVLTAHRNGPLCEHYSASVTNEKADFPDKRQGDHLCRKTKSGPIIYGNYFGFAGDVHDNGVGVSGSIATDRKGNAKSAPAKPGSSVKEESGEFVAVESKPIINGALKGKDVGAGNCGNKREPPKAYQQGHEAEQYRKLFVGGLTLNTTDEMLKDFYSRFGVVVRCFVVRDSYSKRSRGFGFVTFRENESVDFAMEARPHIIDSKTIEPKRALPKTLENQVSVKKLRVSGITSEITEQNLKKHFAAFGTVTDVVITLDKEGRTRGFAFVTFDDYDAVDKCVLVRSHTICGNRCDVKKELSNGEMRSAEQHQRERQERGAQSRGDGGRWSGASDVGYGRGDIHGGGYDAGYNGGYGCGRLGHYGGGAYGDNAVDPYHASGYGGGYSGGWYDTYGRHGGVQGGWSGNQWLGGSHAYGGQQTGWYQQTQGYGNNVVGYGWGGSYR